jgi:hypothetical protein
MLINEVNMEHELKLQPRYYEYILNGSKDIEIRLYDEKRQKINLGDIIIFKKEPELNESFKVKVVGLLRYENFDSLFNDFTIDRLADRSMSKSELLEELEKFYTKEKQKEYGVLGIRIEKVRN